MSETDHQGTSVLLPESKVAVFSHDSDTLGVARRLADDWRFTRVDVAVEEGDVDAAIAAYKDYASPELVIIQSDKIDNDFTAKLEELSAHCDEGTAAIVIGPVNDVYLYRSMINMGISDYLVRPVQAEIMADVVVKSLIERLGVTGSCLIALIGAKGGVGVSALSQGLASGVAGVYGQKTVLLDGCGGCSTLSVGLGFEPSTTLSEAARAVENQDDDSLGRMLIKVADKSVGDALSVLASGGEGMLEPTVTAEQFEDIVDMLMMKYPVVVADLSQAPHALQRVVLARANQIQVVATPSLAALRQGRSLIQEIKDVRGGEGENIALVVNMCGMAGKQEVAKADIEAAMGMKISAQIGFEPQVFMGAESAGQVVLADSAGRRLIETHILPVVRGLLGVSEVHDAKACDDVASGGFMAGILKKFKTGS